MVKAILFDFSRVVLFPKDKKYKGGLNVLHKKLSQKPNYQLLNHFELNEELIHFLVKQVKDKLPIFLFTFGNIQNEPELAEDVRALFKKIYSAEELNFNKEDSQSFLYIAKDIGVKPQEIIFIDDKKVNVEAAQRAGLKAFQFMSNGQIINEISKFL